MCHPLLRGSGKKCAFYGKSMKLSTNDLYLNRNHLRYGPKKNVHNGGKIDDVSVLINILIRF